MVAIYFWRCYLKEYRCELDYRVNNLEDGLRGFDSIDFKECRFALFKDGIEPYEEDENNKFKLTYGCIKRVDQRNFLISCFKTSIFELRHVNGIYINERKFSIWLKRPCEIFPFSGLKVKKTEIKNERGPSDLDREWTLGFFNKTDFKITDYFENELQKHISTKYSGDLKRWTENSYCMRINDGEKAGILLSSNIVEEKEWRKHHIFNRFIFASMKIDLTRAKTVWSKIAINIVQSIFPRISNIYLAFGFYENQTLKIGIYLSGKLIRLTNNSEDIHNENADEIGHQVKNIIFEICDRNVMVQITNAVPSLDSNFTDRKYEYRIYKEI